MTTTLTNEETYSVNNLVNSATISKYDTWKADMENILCNTLENRKEI